MAVHIASALPQVHRTPWLEADWSNHHFHFLVGETPTGNISTKTLVDERPLVTRTFHDARVVPSDPFVPRPVEEEEKETISCLRKIGVMILQLIFVHGIEDCSFRGVYCGPGGQPNNFTDVATANQWTLEVRHDSGPKVADAVRRCLHCAFGPKPRLGDKKFRESVYQDVIEPLINYSATWKYE